MKSPLLAALLALLGLASAAFAIAGERIEGVVAAPFTEKTALASDLHIDRGHELMEFFLKVR